MWPVRAWVVRFEFELVMSLRGTLADVNRTVPER
jgi:hypothetical protein